MSFEVLGPKRVRMTGHPVTASLIDVVCTDEPDDPLEVESKYSLVFDASRLKKVSALVRADVSYETQLLTATEFLLAPFNPDEAAARIPCWSIMRDYQKQGAEFLITRKRTMLFDAPGLGKTIQSLALAAWYGGDVLIVSPASNQTQWNDEGTQKFLGESAVVLNSKNARELLVSTKRYWVVTYESGRDGLCEALRERAWTTVIFDEAQKFKTPTSLQTRKWLLEKQSVGRRASNVVFLTGTPLSRARFAQLFGMMSCCFLNMNWTKWFRGEFAYRYCDGHVDPATRQWQAEGISRHEEFLRLLFMRALRRSKAILEKDLPPKTRRIVYVDLTEDEMRQYREVDRERLDTIREKFAATDPSDNLRLKRRLCNLKSQLRRELAVAKQRACREFLKGRLGLEGKEIAFCEHVTMRNALVEECTANGVRSIEINGDVPTGARHDLVKELSSEDTAAKIGVFSIMAAGSGLNCTPGVRRCVFYELCWNPSDADQCEDRAWRFGTKYPIEVVYVVARGTVEESIIAAHQEKSRDVNTLLDDGKVPARTFDTDLMVKMIAWGVDARFVRDYHPTRDFESVDRWIQALPTKKPESKTYVRCAALESDEFESWDGFEGDEVRYAETEREFVAFMRRETEKSDE